VRILFTNNHLKVLQGSETATYTMVHALARAGHQVSVFTRDLGLMSDRLVKDGFDLTSNLEDWKDRKFDVAHCHHYPMAVITRKVFPDLSMVFLSHGVIPDMERPPPKETGVAVHCAVSEEVKRKLVGLGVENVDVMRNAVDCRRFRPRSRINERPERVMVLSNHFSGCVKRMADACKRIGTKRFWVVGQEKLAQWDVEAAIDNADLVVTLGRGCLESMACGRAVLVFDMHGADGLLRPKNWTEVRKNNFSGRRYKHQWTVDDIVQEMEGYTQMMGSLNRAYAVKHHNIDVEVEQWKVIYLRAIKIGVPS